VYLILLLLLLERRKTCWEIRGAGIFFLDYLYYVINTVISSRCKESTILTKNKGKQKVL